MGVRAAVLTPCRRFAAYTKCFWPPQELAHQDIIRQLKLEHAKEITKLRQEFELQARELQQKYEASTG